MRFIQQNASGVIPVGPFVSPTDGVTNISNLVASALNGVLTVNGVSTTYYPASFTYDTNGQYFASTPTGLVALGPARISFSNSSLFAPVWDDLSVVSPAVYASLFGAAALSTYAGGAVASVIAPVTITQSFPANFSALVINASGVISHVALTDVATSVTNSVNLPTIAPSGYGGGSSPDPWAVVLPGSYAGAQAGNILGGQATLPIAGSVHAGATQTNFVLSITSGNSPVTSDAIDNRGCLFKTGALIGAYPTIISSIVQSANVVAITVSGMPVAPSLNDQVQII